MTNSRTRVQRIVLAATLAVSSGCVETDPVDTEALNQERQDYVASVNGLLTINGLKTINGLITINGLKTALPGFRWLEPEHVDQDRG